LTYAFKSNNLLDDTVNVLYSFDTSNSLTIQSNTMTIDVVLETGVAYWIEQESNYGPFSNYGLKGAIITYVLP